MNKTSFIKHLKIILICCLLSLLSILMASCDDKETYGSRVDKALSQFGASAAKINPHELMEAVLDAARLSKSPPRHEPELKKPLAALAAQTGSFAKGWDLAADAPSKKKYIISFLEKFQALLGGAELEKLFSRQLFSLQQRETIKDTLEQLYTKTAEDPDIAASALPCAALSSLFAQAAYLELCPAAYSDHFYEKALSIYSPENGFYDDSIFTTQWRPAYEILVLAQLARRNYSLPDNANLPSETVAQLLKRNSLVLNRWRTTPYYALSFCKILEQYSISESVPMATNFSDYIEFLSGIKDRMLNDEISIARLLLSSKTQLGIREENLSKPYVDTLPSPTEVADEFTKSSKQDLIDYLLDNDSLLLSNVYLASSNDPVELFLVNKRGSCRSFANYYVRFFEELGYEAYGATLFDFPSLNAAHSLMVFKNGATTNFLFGDSGLLISENPDKSYTTRMAGATRYSMYLQALNQLLIRKYASGDFEWVPLYFDPKTYHNIHFPFRLDFTGVKSYNYGTTDLQTNDDAWKDLAYGRLDDNSPRVNQRINMTSGEVRSSFVGNLFVLGSLEMPYQQKFMLKDCDSSVRVIYHFSHTGQPEFTVTARVENADISGPDSFTAAYAHPPYPQNEAEAKWEFTLTPKQKTGDITLYIDCPNLTARGQTLFIDSITFEKTE